MPFEAFGIRGQRRLIGARTHQDTKEAETMDFSLRPLRLCVQSNVHLHLMRRMGGARPL